MSEASDGSSERVKVVVSNEDGLSTVSVLEALSLDEEFADVVLTVPVVVVSLLCFCELSHLLTGGGSCLTTTGDSLSEDLASFCCLCLDDEKSFGIIGV